jgi:membrane-bound ClpP family serine protease
MNGVDWPKLYTRIIGVAFVLVVISLVLDIYGFGHRPETWHKIFHVVLGLIVISNWNNKKFYRPFCLVNGIFFSFVALFGWTFMDFGGLDAFNFVDTVLHSIVGLSGLVIAFIKK